jgi:two-component system response regulator HydG
MRREGGYPMPRRVLLVENNDDHRKLLSILLRDAGLVPVPAWNAEDGLQILDDCVCDLAVFDIQLPGMDGLAALSVVAEKLPRLPVVLVTASGDVREAHARSLGAKGFLRKPFSANEFLDAVGAALDSGARTLLPRSRVASGPSTKDAQRGS